MFHLHKSLEYYLYPMPVDMRKSLCAMIVVAVYGGDSELLGSDTILSETGIKSVLAGVKTDSLLTAGGHFFAVSSIRPPGDEKTTLLAADTLRLKVEQKQVETLLKADGFPKQVYPSSTGYMVDVHYQGADNMEIAVEVRDPSGAWIGGGDMDVPDGEGVARIWAGLIKPTLPGTDYYWKTHIRPRGTTWRESIYGLSFLPFQVVEEIVPEIVISSEGWPLADTVAGFVTELTFTALENSDIGLDLSREGGALILDTLVSVIPGSETLQIELLFDSLPEPGSDYQLTGVLYWAGTDSVIVSDTLKDLEILETEDPVGFSGQEVPEPEKFRIYPNPASGKLFVDLAEASAGIKALSISDMAGRRLLYLDQVDGTTSSRSFELDISALPPGFYTLRFFSGSMACSGGFIVK